MISRVWWKVCEQLQGFETVRLDNLHGLLGPGLLVVPKINRDKGFNEINVDDSSDTV